jgi:hypothetical protein
VTSFITLGNYGGRLNRNLPIKEGFLVLGSTLRQRPLADRILAVPGTRALPDVLSSREKV